MKALIYVPQGRQVEASLHSIVALNTAGYETTLIFDRENNGNDGAPDWYERALVKQRRARILALGGGYDALLNIEDDIIVPPNTLPELDAVGADVAYGLAVWRNYPHKWSATFEAVWDSHIDTLDDDMEAARAAWGGPIPTLGCGLFCTLIRRHVLEAFDFRRVGPAAADWGLAFDTRDYGFTQMTHTGVVCGHIDGDEALWPDPVTRYRRTNLTEREAAYDIVKS